MWDKALWYREFQQFGIRIWLIPLLHFFFYGFQRMNTWILEHPERIANRLQNISSQLEFYIYNELESFCRFLLVFIAMLLSIVLISFERRNGKQELLFSLPYSRKQIYAVKWLFGAAILAGSLILNTVLDMVIVLSSRAAPYFSFVYYADQVLYSGLVIIGIFSLSMFLGTISGSVASHSVYLFMLYALPWYLYEMFWVTLDVHGVYFSNWRDSKWERWINFMEHVGARYPHFSISAYVTFAVFLFGFAVAGVYMYSRNRTENNGMLMISKAWEKVLHIGFVACFSLLAASMMRSFLSLGLIGYYLGLLLGMVISSWIIRHLTRLRLKI